MSRRLTAPRLMFLAGALILATGLAACGKVGQLERAQPLFGHKVVAGVPAPKPGAPMEDTNRTVQTVDPRDRSGEGVVPPPPGAAPATPPPATPPQ